MTGLIEARGTYLARTLVFLAFLVLAPVIAHAQACGVCGDVNGDGRVDVADALFTAQWTAGLRPAVACPDAADLTGNGRVDVLDAVFIAATNVGFAMHRPTGASKPCKMVPWDPR